MLTGQGGPRDWPGKTIKIALFAAGMAVVLHLVWLLSPRKVDSGPRGIVVTKAGEIRLIPWESIASFRISRSVLPGSLTLQLRSGEVHRIVLPHDANPTEISRQIGGMIGERV